MIVKVTIIIKNVERLVVIEDLEKEYTLFDVEKVVERVADSALCALAEYALIAFA